MVCHVAKSASNFIKTPASLNNILTPLAQKKGSKESVGVGDVASSGLSALSFAVKNIGSVIDVVGSISFYKEEAEKIPMGKGVKEEASFFLKLLDDPDSVKFLQANSAKLGNLVETIAPTLISIAVREVSKLPELQERIKAHEKQYGLLTSLEEKLEKLEAKPIPSELDSQQITDFTQQIGNRKLLEQRISLAKTVEALEKNGITVEYIQQKLLPIAINPLKEILKKPEDIIAVANAGLDIVLQKDPKKTIESLQFIASKIDVGALIGSSGLQDFLINESGNLAKIATTIMTTNEGVKSSAKELGITPEIVQQVIPAVTKIVAVALADTPKLTEVYNEILASNAKLSDITTKEKAQQEIDRSELNEEQIQELDKQIEELAKKKNVVLSGMIGQASEIVLEDNVLNSVRDNISGLLDKNQEAISGMVAHNIEQLDKASLPGQLLSGVSPSFAKNTVAAVTGLVSVVLKETSNEQIKGFVASGQSLLTASQGEAPALVQGLVSQGMAILGNTKIAASLQNVGAILEESNTEIAKIAVNAVENTTLKGVVTAEQINDVVPIATKVVGAVLSSVQDISTIVTKSQELGANLDKTTQGLTAKQVGSFGMIIDSLSHIVAQPGISQTLSKDLPAFLEKNRDSIPRIAIDIVKKTPALATLIKEMGVSDDLIKDAAKLGADILIDAAPMVDKLAKATLKEKDQLVTIISDIRDLANAPEENQKKSVLKVVSNIITLKENSPELRDIFDKELPGLLEKNQQQSAKVIDGVIHTKAGPGLKLKTEKIIKIVAIIYQL